MSEDNKPDAEEQLLAMLQHGNQLATVATQATVLESLVNVMNMASRLHDDTDVEDKDGRAGLEHIYHFAFKKALEIAG